jgi:predicted nuclease of predicted toxin-antitoxin system
MPSVITLRLANMQADNVNHYLIQVLAKFSNELETGALVSVHEQAIRVRQLPIT